MGREQRGRGCDLNSPPDAWRQATPPPASSTFLLFMKRTSTSLGVCCSYCLSLRSSTPLLARYIPLPVCPGRAPAQRLPLTTSCPLFPVPECHSSLKHVLTPPAEFLPPYSSAFHFCACFTTAPKSHVFHTTPSPFRRLPVCV